MTTWILLRGLMRESRHWGGFPDCFAQEMPEAKVVCLDLPGTGKLHAQDSPRTVDGMAEAYRTMLAATNHAPPYCLLALSLGAMVAVAWAHRYPGEVAGAVLINSSLRPYSPFYRRLHWRNYPALVRLALNPRDIDARERMIMRLTSCRMDEDVMQSWIGYQREYPVSQANALRQLIAAATYRAPADAPPVRTLILASRFDRLVDSGCSKRLAQAWKTDIAMHPAAGHDLPLDDGAWVAQQVRRWW